MSSLLLILGFYIFCALDFVLIRLFIHRFARYPWRSPDENMPILAGYEQDSQGEKIVNTHKYDNEHPEPGHFQDLNNPK